MIFHPRTTVEDMDAGKTRVSTWRSRRKRTSDVELITDARQSPLENWHKRRKVYAILQMARIPMLALSGLLMWWTGNLWLSASVAIISLPLPWIAVLLANETGDSDPRNHHVYKPQLVREARQREAIARQQGEQLGAPQRRALESATEPDHGTHPDIIDLD
ncbi:DUF3099 domain-containing protein [Corynebacterium anserum]|uniref:DUF3099 domain-containing protein n=1 Tax=Corynebacterium anserum TaxID=2684406 RepID=A0A7G7YNN7_9CORY|nr:DUF3099 domain-containing protein [Corynebacterium anserum]MBC2681690.1 DUF3099 domain-containing protein [Corynebacterium anserum]QNH96107.1 DUF3099 domain-containing protein [Corynebacterium anserum]